ncbi:hypothetical protein DV736_g5105, partial [Chaetothyriales sp. CBS 134916]
MRTSIFVTITLFTSVLSTAVVLDSGVKDLSIRDTYTLETFNPLEKRKGGGGGGKGGESSGSSGSGGKALSILLPIQLERWWPHKRWIRHTAFRSPSRGIIPYALPVAGFALFPSLWLFGSLWAYPYPIGYHWLDPDGNRTSNVTCVCQRSQVCGCDPQDNSTFLNQVVSNGTGGAPVNSSLVRTGVVNGTTQTFINGSLANGTTATGGTDPSNESEISAAARAVMELSGYWVMVGTVLVAVYLT